jgi:hypothetical protein
MKSALWTRLSSLSVELLLEYLRYYEEPGLGFFRLLGFVVSPYSRYLTVPGRPRESPTLLILDPNVSDVSQSKRLTREINLVPSRLPILYQAFDQLRSVFRAEGDNSLFRFLSHASSDVAAEMLWISRPEVVYSRRPRTVPLCAPSPYVTVVSGTKVSTVGIFCRDDTGQLGVSACFHGSGPPGTAVTVRGATGCVKWADSVQDIVFIPIDQGTALPPMYGLSGVRTFPPPSQTEPVVFDGAGSQTKVNTKVISHDVGILRKRRTLQLRFQTPPDTNSGDSGAALIDSSDRVVGFAFERTGIGEVPELTDWIWSDNALAALGLTPV